MPHLELKPIQPLPDDGEQPVLLVRYTCMYPGCGKESEREQMPGFVPRYCEEHKKLATKEATKERVKRWREENHERDRQNQRNRRSRNKQQQNPDLR